MVKYKIATIGSKGKERYWEDKQIINTIVKYNTRFMATLCVEESQYKTYPDTYHTQAEAEEALASIVLTALGYYLPPLLPFLIIVLGIAGITGQGGDNRRKETKDMLVYAQRVVSLLGQYSHLFIGFHNFIGRGEVQWCLVTSGGE